MSVTHRVEDEIHQKIGNFVPCFGGSELHQAMESLFGKSLTKSRSERRDSAGPSSSTIQKGLKPEIVKQLAMENEVDPHMRELIYSINRFATLVYRYPEEFDHIYHYGLLLQELAAKLRYDLEMKIRIVPVELITELLDMACDKYENALELKPTFHAAFYNWGVALSELSSIWKNGNAQKALYYLHAASQKYAEAIKHCPDNPRGLNNWGLVLQEVSNYQHKMHRKVELAVQAIDKFRKAIRLRLSFDHGCYNMGTIFYTHASNLRDCNPNELTNEQGQLIPSLQQIVGTDCQISDALDIMMRSAAQYICLAATLEPSNQVYQNSVAIVKHLLPRPYLKTGYLTVANFATLGTVREMWEKQWFVLDGQRMISGVGPHLHRNSGKFAAYKAREHDEMRSNQYNIAVEEMMSIDRCLELALPEGHGFWIQTKSIKQGLYFLCEDEESANVWVDCLKLCQYITIQNKSQTLTDLLGP